MIGMACALRQLFEVGKGYVLCAKITELTNPVYVLACLAQPNRNGMFFGIRVIQHLYSFQYGIGYVW